MFPLSVAKEGPLAGPVDPNKKNSERENMMMILEQSTYK